MADTRKFFETWSLGIIWIICMMGAVAALYYISGLLATYFIARCIFLGLLAVAFVPWIIGRVIEAFE